jgi:hypothetical protein
LAEAPLTLDATGLPPFPAADVGVWAARAALDHIAT